jgi:hypothetical protein
LNDHKKQTFKTQMGIDATVQRLEAKPEIASKPNRMLIDLGLSLQDEDKFQLKGYTYRGSAAVHIYTHDLLNQLDFISQTNPLDVYKCPQDIASRAFNDLLNSMKALYGHRRAKLRSGF